MQADPESGSVDFINFDSPLELLQTLLQQVGGAATVNKLCKVCSKMAAIICNYFFCFSTGHAGSNRCYLEQKIQETTWPTY